MNLAAEELHKRLSGLTIQGAQHLVASALGSTLHCETCRPKAYPDLLKFNDLFATEVERRVVEVCL
jgi:hypothetical protein